MSLVVVGYGSNVTFWRLLLWRLSGNRKLLYLSDPRSVTAAERKLRLEISFWEKSVGNFRSDDGRNLTWHNEQKIHEFIESLCDGLKLKELAKLFPSCLKEVDILLWYRRYLTMELYERVAFWEAVFADIRSWPDEKVILFESSSLVRSYLLKRCENQNRFSILAAARQRVKSLFVLPRLAWKLLTAPFESPKNRPLTIALPLFHGIHRKDGVSDLFWFKNSGLKPENVIFYNENKNSVAKELIRPVVDGGFRYVSDIVASLPLKERLGVATKLLLLLLRATPHMFGKFWLFSGIIEYNRHFFTWFYFFKTQNVKLHIHHGDTNISLPVYIHALEKACNGVDLSYDFSASGFILPQLSRPVCQIQYIAWGKWSHEAIKLAGNQARTKDWQATFITGCHKQYLRNTPMAPEIEEAIYKAKQKQKKIIGVFDLSCSSARLLPLDSRERFYEIMLSIISQSRNSFFLIKPQRRILLPESLEAKYRALEKEGKCYWAQPGILETLLQPIFTQLDFAVGLGGFNSALIEAVSEEVAHVYFDEWDCIPEIFQEIVPDELMATSAPVLEAILQKVDQDQFSVELIENWPLYLRTVDPFRDAKGSERLGKIIKLWSEILQNNNNTPSDFLPAVIGKYRDLYGIECVVDTKAI